MASHLDIRPPRQSERRSRPGGAVSGMREEIAGRQGRGGREAGRAAASRPLLDPARHLSAMKGPSEALPAVVDLSVRMAAVSANASAPADHKPRRK